jgi:hypothetical protein
MERAGGEARAGHGDEAHYFAAVINSAPCRLVIESYSSKSTGSFGSPHVLTNVAIPKFKRQDNIHITLGRLSEHCHDAVAKGNMKQIAAFEAEIDRAAAKLWDITDDELKAIQEALAEAGKSKKTAADDEEE